MGIPKFLKISDEDRRRAREAAGQRTQPMKQVTVKRLTKQEWKALDKRRVEKNRRGLERMKEKHMGERYIRPKRKDGRVVVPGRWVPVDVEE